MLRLHTGLLDQHGICPEFYRG